MEVTIGLAFLAGLVSFLSPCVFSLVPVYIGYLSGRSVVCVEHRPGKERIDTFLHGLAFVVGFSIVFILLGLAVSTLGSFLYDIRTWLAKIGGIVVILFGLHMTGLLKIPFLEYDLRPQSRMEHQRSYLSSFLLGIFFSAGWSPCVGPVLGSILTLALNGASISIGIRLLTAYSLGLAIPFLVAALGIGWITGIIKHHQKALYVIQIVMGGLLILVGIMLFMGTFEQISRFGSFFNFGL